MADPSASSSRPLLDIGTSGLTPRPSDGEISRTASRRGRRRISDALPPKPNRRSACRRGAGAASGGRYEEVATLAGGLAHEIRNPLSTIGMLLELMAEDLAAPESPRDRRLSRRLQTVQRECQHLEEILNAFLQFARAGELSTWSRRMSTSSCASLSISIRPEAREHGIEISPHLASDLPPVLVDRSLFRQMLLNLALNAQQAMPAGGLLELQTQPGRRPRPTGAHRQRRRHGRGDAPEAVSGLFSTKTDGQRPGTGRPSVKSSTPTMGASPAKRARTGNPVSDFASRPPRPHDTPKTTKPTETTRAICPAFRSAS